MHDPINLDRLAEMLHRGNAGVPHLFRDEFYATKNFLLTAFGSPLERDIQRIDDKCFRCGGSGDYNEYDLCWKCEGTGIYRTRFIWLDKFRLGPYTFHRPMPNVTFHGTPTPTIKGRIEHKPYEDSADCALTLAWLFNRDALKRRAEELAGCMEIPGNGPGVFAVNEWMRDKRLAEAKAWKEECERPVPGCPF